MEDIQKKEIVIREIKKAFTDKLGDDTTWAEFKTFVGDVLKPGAINVLKTRIQARGVQVGLQGDAEKQRGLDIQAIDNEL